MTTKIPRGRRSGTLETRTYANGRVAYVGRLRLADGTRSGRVPAPDGMTKAAAQRWLAALQAREDAEGIVYGAKVEAARAAAAAKRKPHKEETVDAWFARHLAAKECGTGYRDTSRCRWRKHVSPMIGKLPIASLTRDQIEGVRDYLDTAIDGGMSGASARNVWSLVTSAMKAACAAKDRTLRVHAAPIYVGILPPKSTRPRRRPWLYPSEWDALSRCEAVPLAVRRLYALALYLGLRPGELRALTWGDVDAAAGSVTVSKAWDHAAQKMGPPKTEAGHRTFPIHPELLPLLAALRGADDELVIGKTDADRIAGQFRAHLRLADVKRPRLFALTATEEPVDFRSLRDSYATWSSLEGVPVTALRRRMGHETLETTDRYVKAAESIDARGIGAPFPSLAHLCSGRAGRARGPGSGPPRPENVTFPGEFQRRGWDSNAHDLPAPSTIPDVSGSPTSETPAENTPKPPLVARVLAHEVASSKEAGDPLERALVLAAEAGRFDVVAALARELEARRLASAGNVTPIGKRGGK